MTGSQAAPTASWAIRMPMITISGTPRSRPGRTKPSSKEPELPTMGGSRSAGPDDDSTGTPEAPIRTPGTAPDGGGEAPGLTPAMAGDGLVDGDGGELDPIGRLGVMEIVGVGTTSVGVGTGRLGVGSGTLGNGGNVGSGGSVGGVIVGSGTGGSVGNRTVGTGSGGNVGTGSGGNVGSGRLGTGTGRLGSATGRLGSAAGKAGSASGPMAATGRATSNRAPRTAVTTRTLPP
jgi:hypothetical protein